eukprot:m.20202 g.20202  ORF g.20202 m.20202 type:complete len:189 (+) comp5549_c0_seq1:303-869(+)
MWSVSAGTACLDMKLHAPHLGKVLLNPRLPNAKRLVGNAAIWYIDAQFCIHLRNFRFLQFLISSNELLQYVGAVLGQIESFFRISIQIKQARVGLARMLFRGRFIFSTHLGWCPPAVIGVVAVARRPSFQQLPLSHPYGTFITERVDVVHKLRTGRGSTRSDRRPLVNAINGNGASRVQLCSRNACQK